MPPARLSSLERFTRKCEFMPHSGCVLWRGGTIASRNGTERTGVFWDRGRKHLARRWAAEHVHGIDLMGKEVSLTCGEPLCVEHVEAVNTGMANPAQFYVFVDLGFCEMPPKRVPPQHYGPPIFGEPQWLRG
jgi:hypothetical protein